MSPSRCTGACCVEVHVSSHTREEIRLIRDGVTPVGLTSQAEAALLLTLFRPIRQDDSGYSTHTCQALTPAGCALAYEQRPSMCSRYPYGGGAACSHCGSRTDAEARGVALAVRT